MKLIFYFLSILLSSLAHGLEYPMSATPSWIEVADRSAFVGIIECVRAGALISEFKVVETWKGDEIGGTFHYRASYRPGGRLLVCMQPSKGSYICGCSSVILLRYTEQVANQSIESTHETTVRLFRSHSKEN